MEKFNLTQTGQEVQEILDGAAKLSDVNTEKERAELAEEALGASIQQNAEDIDAIEAKIPSDATDENPLTDKEYVDGLVSDEATAREQADETLQGNIDAEETRAKAAEKQNADDIDAIEEKIPSDASSGNQLTTKNYVDNSVATASATFRGTYNLVSDLHLTVDASRSDIASALGNAIANADNNDYAFVQIPTSVDTPTEIGSIERYKFNGSAWTYEYTLNNSGYTAAQWAAINSGITSGLVAKLGSLPTASELATALLAKQDVLTFDSAPTPGSLNPVTSAGIHTAIDTEKGARQNADAAIQQAIEAILVLIPSAASALNQLADKAFVNSSIATNTATFRGTFNLVSDLHLALNASHTDVANALANAISSANNNDYCFVQIPTSVDTPTEIRVTERYKFNGTAWAYEYDLNNSGFTVAQWEAINSAITSALVSKLSALPTAAELAASLDGKQAVLTFDNQPTSGSSNPVKSGGVYDVVAAINAKIPSDADPANKLVTEARIATIIGALDADFDLTSADEHITFKMTQRDGQITSVQILTYDIASAAALTTIGGRVSLNESDISNLQAAYAALTQSDVIIVNGALPSSGQQQNIIYRQPDPDHTPPQFYSDFMWNGTNWVLMGQYNNAIDPRPKKGSQNLVTSGGVFDNMGALDVSELNATENPHTIATYADLSAAIAAIPSDYQKGGMSIKFVQSSDNKYVQARLMANSFTTDVTQWQGVDDEPTAGSDNLVKSGGVTDFYIQKTVEIKNISNNNYEGVYIDPNSDKWNPIPNTSCKIYPIQWFDRLTIYANNVNEARVALLKSDKIINYESADFSDLSGFTNLIIVNTNSVIDFERPSDANYLYVYDEGGNYLPKNIKGSFNSDINLYNYLSNSVDNPKTKFSITKNVEDGETVGNLYLEPTEGQYQGLWRSLNGIYGVFIDISDVSTIKIIANNSSEARFALLKSTYIEVGQLADFSNVAGFTNLKILPAGNVFEFTKPSDANYLYLTTTYGDTIFTPSEICTIISGVDILYKSVKEISNKAAYEPSVSDILKIDDYYIIETLSDPNNGKWRALQGTIAYFIDITDVTSISIVANQLNGSRYALLKSPTILGDYTTADFSDAEGYGKVITMTPGSSKTFDKPIDVNYLYIFDYSEQPSYPNKIDLNTTGVSSALNKVINKELDFQADDYNTDKEYGFYILESGETQGKWRALQGTTAYFIDITSVSDISITANLTNGSRYALLKSPIIIPETMADFSDVIGFDNIVVLGAGGFVKFKKPSDANYLYIFDYDGQPSYPVNINLKMKSVYDYTSPLIQSFTKSKLAVLAESDLVTPNIHISIDDCIACFYDLVTNNRQSIYDNVFFSQMKTLHDTYGVKITCNCFLHYYYQDYGYENFYLIDTPNTWKDEFQAAKDWLRFAFHGYDNILWNTQDVTPYYNQFVQAIYQITEDYDCIDTVTRTQSFSGSLTNVKAMMNAEHGVTAFLASCKNGVDLSYYLDREESDYIIRHGVKVDTKNNVLFIKSSIPLDNDSVEDVLADYQENPCSRKYVEIFFHLFPTMPYIVPETITKCNQICDYFINQKGYESHFLMDLFK